MAKFMDEELLTGGLRDALSSRPKIHQPTQPKVKLARYGRGVNRWGRMAEGATRYRPGAGPRSLRAQLALFAVSILAPALLCMAALLFMGMNESRASHERELLATARALSAAIDQDLTAAIAANEVIATSDAIGEENWRWLRRRAARVAGERAWISLADGQGKLIFDTREAADAAPAARAIDPYDDPDPRIGPPSVEPGQISDLIPDPASGRKVVAVRTPVTVAGKRYVLSQFIDPGRFLDLVALRRLPDQTMVSVVDRTNRLVSRSRYHERFLGRSATGNMIEALQTSDEGVVRSRSLEGQRTVVAYTRSPISGWATLVVVPRTVFEAPVQRNMLGLAVASFLILGFGAAAAFYYSQTIARELSLLEADAAALGHGETVEARSGLISNFAAVQQALTRASEELSVRSERQRLMINELNHRVKNTLATVQSLAMQTFRGGDPDAPAKFDTRLAALASAHDLLTQTNWTDVSLADVVARCAGPADNRLISRGPPVTLPPQAALALYMCLHELTTNSLKYGALSASRGRVDVTWELDEAGRNLSLTWRESGGPQVAAPRSAGFGTRLIDRLLRHELDGEATRSFEPTGLVFTARLGLTGPSRFDNDFGG
jgi:two-component sensor histidine kinase